MSESTTLPNPDGHPNDSLYPVARRLLESVVAIGNHHQELVDRRRAFLTVLMEEVGADVAFWAWGHGNPTESSITPVAMIEIGFQETQLAIVMKWALDPEAFCGFYHRVYAEMQGVNQSRSSLMADFNDEERKGFPVMRNYMAQGGWGSWLHNVRYFPKDIWGSLLVLRNTDRDEFGPREAAILELAATSVSWLHATAEESIPAEAFVGLTPRQRAVMLMLLDGLARKAIASQLGITDDTVGDHIKSIYKHFGVRSAAELAARFLRNR